MILDGMRVSVQPDTYSYRTPDGSKLVNRAGTIAWWEHQKAWEGYSKRFGTDQSAERIAERHGFSYGELVKYLGHPPTTWVPR